MKHTLLILALAFLLDPFGRLPAKEAPFILRARGNYGGLLQVPDADVALRPYPVWSARHGTRGHLTNENPINSASITVLVADTGQFSAAMYSGGNKYSFKGQFDSNGSVFEREFQDLSDPELTLKLTLTLHTFTPAPTIHGDLSGTGLGGRYIARGDLSGAEPDSEAGKKFGGKLNTSFIDPPNYGSLAQPVPGDGFAVTRVSKRLGFAARLIGRLPDDQPFSAGSLLRGTKYTIYSRLYNTKGPLGGLTVGELNADASLETIQNILLWAKSEGFDPRYYREGFDTGYGIKTLLYIFNSLGSGNPSKQIPPIGINRGPVNATLIFKDGNLGEMNGQDITLTAKIKITPFGAKVVGSNPQNIALQTNAAAATFKGSFIHPVSGQRTAFHGGFIQAGIDKNGEGRGSFKGSLPADAGGLIESGSVRMIVD